MIISRTPLRISFFGGGTDYPDWYLKEGGAVLSTTIDKHIYITCRYLPPFFENRHSVIWAKMESVLSIDQIEHPAIREGLRYLGFTDETGIDIHYQGDIPSRSGMGSSSAFMVGLVNALTALNGRRIGKHQMALEAIHLEQTVLNEAVGAQDQVAAAYGGLNYIEFLRDGEICVHPMILSPARLRQLDDGLMLFYPGISRFASEIAAEVIANIPSKTDELHQMRGLVDQAVDVLSGDRSLDDFGALLHETWMLKRRLSKRISNDTVDMIYARARKAGALGGKLLGAGESGFMLFYAPEDRRAAVRAELKDLLHVPFRFSAQGSTVIYYDPETYYGTSREVSAGA
jgi:D-glycero-alpha-D-manno-heptose-7-phosphate kinase